MKGPAREDDRLPEGAEALLGGWPAPSRSALEWEDAASATMARIRDTAEERTPDELLAAPLPAEESDGTFDLDPPGDDLKLADIARSVMDGGARARKEMAKEGLLVAAQAARALPLSEPAPSARSSGAAGLQGRISGAPSPSRAPASSGSRPVPALHEAPARSEFARREVGSRSLLGALLGGGALGLAAAVALFLSLRGPAQEGLPSGASGEPVASRGPDPAPVAAAPAAPKPLQLEDLAPPPAARPPEAPAKAGPSDKNALPAGKEPLAFRVNKESSKDSLVLEEREEATQAAKAAPPASAARPQAAPAGAAEPAPAAPAAQAAGTPAEQAPVAAAPAQSAAVPAVPERPTTGAVQAAVGSVMTGARSCLVGQTEGSKVAITWGSDGQVKGVSVASPAQGTPAEGCLRSALMGARVAPFSEATFSASLTIRPP